MPREADLVAYDEWKQEGVPWDEAVEVWELQGGPHLTAGALRALLERVDPSLPIRISLYEGVEGVVPYDPVEVVYVGEGDRPDALTITVARLGGATNDG